MVFSVRNVYYLRVSATTIVTTVLFLDQRHVAWMNQNPDIFKQAVYNVVRPCLGELLRSVDEDELNKMQVVEQGSFVALI